MCERDSGGVNAMDKMWWRHVQKINLIIIKGNMEIAMNVCKHVILFNVMITRFPCHVICTRYPSCVIL